MTPRDWIEMIAAGSIPLAIVALFVNRWLTNKSLGVRAIQMVSVITLTPAIIVLAMEKIVDGAAVAALIGGVIGYLFANFSEYDRAKYRDKDND